MFTRPTGSQKAFIPSTTTESTSADQPLKMLNYLSVAPKQVEKQLKTNTLEIFSMRNSQPFVDLTPAVIIISEACVLGLLCPHPLVSPTHASIKNDVYQSSRGLNDGIEWQYRKRNDIDKMNMPPVSCRVYCLCIRGRHCRWSRQSTRDIITRP